MLGALVGAAVGLAVDGLTPAPDCEHPPLAVAEATAWPVRDSLLGHDPGKALSDNLARELAPLRWLGDEVDVVRVARALTTKGIVKLIEAGGNTSVLLVQIKYRRGPAFDTLVVAAEVTLLTGEVRSTTHASGSTVEEPVIAYHNLFSTSGRPKGWPGGKVSLQDAAAIWAAEGNGRQVLDGGLSDLARMIAFDLEAGNPDAASLKAAQRAARASAGAGVSPAQAPAVGKWIDRGHGVWELTRPYSTVSGISMNATTIGYVVREGNGRSWVRLQTGELLSIGEHYQ